MDRDLACQIPLSSYEAPSEGTAACRGRNTAARPWKVTSTFQGIVEFGEVAPVRGDGAGRQSIAGPEVAHPGSRLVLP
ncbi:hypothetical protein GCM10023259_054800 [Thermocatellispora tengchongensis]